jgi:hypothetical protein
MSRMSVLSTVLVSAGVAFLVTGGPVILGWLVLEVVDGVTGLFRRPAVRAADFKQHAELVTAGMVEGIRGRSA